MASEKATSITASTTINAPINKVWYVLKKYDRISDFHPLVKTSTAINEVVGLGAKRSCVLSPMGEMIEEITDWVEGKSFTSEVIGGKMLPPYQFMRGTIELNADGARTNVIFTFSYLLKFGALGRLMNTVMVEPQFRKAPPKYMAGLKNHIESRAAVR